MYTYKNIVVYIEKGTNSYKKYDIYLWYNYKYNYCKLTSIHVYNLLLDRRETNNFVLIFKVSIQFIHFHKSWPLNGDVRWERMGPFTCHSLLEIIISFHLYLIYFLIPSYLYSLSQLQ